MKILIILCLVNFGVVAGGENAKDGGSTADNVSRAFNKNFALAHNNFLKKTDVYLTDTSIKAKVNAILSQIISVYKPEYDALFNNNYHALKELLDLSGFQKFYDFLSATTSLTIKQNNINFDEFNLEAGTLLEDSDFTFIQTTISILNYIVNTIRRISDDSKNPKICARKYADKYTMLMNKAYEGIYDGPKNCLDRNFNINSVIEEMQKGINVWKKSFWKLKNCLEEMDGEFEDGAHLVARSCIKDVSTALSSFLLPPKFLNSNRFFFIFSRSP